MQRNPVRTVCSSPLSVVITSNFHRHIQYPHNLITSITFCNYWLFFFCREQVLEASVPAWPSTRNGLTHLAQYVSILQRCPPVRSRRSQIRARASFRWAHRGLHVRLEPRLTEQAECGDLADRDRRQVGRRHVHIGAGRSRCTLVTPQ